MNIITEEEKHSRLVDGIHTLINLSEEDFEKVIEDLEPKANELQNICFFYSKDECELPKNPIQIGLEQSHGQNDKYIGRGYYGANRFTIYKVFSELEKLLETFSEDSNEYRRIQRILSTRNLEKFKSYYIVDKKQDKETIDKVFGILSNKQMIENFSEFDNKEEYLSIIGEIFGNEKGEIGDRNKIFQNFYIPEIEKLKCGYQQLAQKFNMARYADPMYEFRKLTWLTYLLDKVIRKEDEPNWKVNPKLCSAIYEEMPENLSLEEKAMYVYCKMCYMFSYDDGYFYKDKEGAKRYTNEFSEEHLESIVPESKITCWDFSRIFSKFINEIDGDIESVIISKGEDGGHFLTGFYTDKVSVMLEAINGRDYGTNDLMKLKHGIKPEGIIIISDPDHLIEKAIDSVFSYIVRKEQTSIHNYVRQLQKLPKENYDEDFEVKLKSFIDSMKENGIFGNEAIQNMNIFFRLGFFGNQIEKTYLAREEKEDETKVFKRMVLMRNRGISKRQKETSSLYLIDTESLAFSECKEYEIVQKLNSGEYIYENERYKMQGIEVEAK